MYEDLVKRLRELPHLLFVQLHGHENVVYEAADAIEKLTARDTNVPRWIPVTEWLPSPEVEVLVFTRDGRIGVDKFFGVIFGLPTFSKKGAKRVTHWIPLPPPPEEGEP